MFMAAKFHLIVCVIAAMLASSATFRAGAQSKRALLVGVSDYGNPREDPGKWRDIHGANDVALLSSLFSKQGYAVTTLVDDRATYANITGALQTVVKDSRKGDTVYLHFSMHGQPFEDLDGDEDDGWDEALIPVDAQMCYVKGQYEGKNHLLDDELEKYISQIRSKLGPTGELFVVLDACHSGTASRGDGDNVRGVRDGFTRSGKTYTPDRTRESNDYFKVATSKGQSPVTFLEACRSYQQNKEVLDRESRTWYGPLSYHISKAMAEHPIDGSGKWVNAVKASMAADRRVRRQNMVIETSK